jgi:adenylate cyclase
MSLRRYFNASLFLSPWLHAAILLGVLVVLVGGSDAVNPFRKRLQFAVFDAYNRMSPRQAPADRPVVIVDIDEESLRVLGQWPWPRTVLAQLVDRLKQAGAKAVAFDMVFAEPDRTNPVLFAQTLPRGPVFDELSSQLAQLPDHDRIFGDSIAQAQNVITGFTHAQSDETLRPPVLAQRILARKQDQTLFLENAQTLNGAATNLPVITQGVAGSGSFIASPAADGILRQIALIFSGRPAFGDTLYPALAAETLRVAQAGRAGFLRISPSQDSRSYAPDFTLDIGTLQTGAQFKSAYQIPLDSDGRMWVYFRSLDSSDYISAHTVLDPKDQDNVFARLKDKIVLVGASPEGLRDIRSTPLDLFVPGVEIHFNAVEQILQGQFLLRPYFIAGLEALAIVGLGLGIIILIPFAGVVVMGAVAALFAMMCFVLSFYAFRDVGLLLDPVYPALSVFIIYILCAFFSYLRSESERRRVRHAFGLYISPDFMKELTRSPDKLQLGGEMRDLTVMFTDIRNFTTVSEGLNPQELIALMNEFLTPMSDQVMANRGTIDKYIGDAMMAFWNAPLSDPQHPHNACRAALSMREVLAPINARIAERARSTGREPVLLRAGIGINTGPCAVGNMGSRQRFAYSALGDAVNTASRLEGLTKIYGMPILLGEMTALAVPDFALLEIDMIRVKGKTNATRIFALLGDDQFARTPAFIDVVHLQSEFLEAYRLREWRKAREILDDCPPLDASLGAINQLYTVYRQRLDDFQYAPPPADWQGIYNAPSK